MSNSGWQPSRLEHHLTLVKEQLSPSQLAGRNVFHYSIPVVSATGDGALEGGDSVDSSKFRVGGGELLVSKLNPHKGHIVITKATQHLSVCSTEFLVLRPRDHASLRFWFWRVQSSDFRGYLIATSQSATRSHMRVRPEAISKYTAVCPPLCAQQAIAAFLDRKTAVIDALIEKKQKLLDLLAEKRAALINQAVTKGLDPNVPMKDSGIPWIGEIPAHWDVKRLKFLVREAVAGPYGASLTKAMYSSAGYRVYGQQQVIPDDFTLGDYYISPEKFCEMRRYLVHPGDVLVSVMGTVGRVAVVPENAESGIINPRLVRYGPDTSIILPRFMQAAMLAECSQAYLRLMAQGATMDGLNMGTLAELALPVPPRLEQQAILDGLRRRTSGVDGAKSSLQVQLDRLREYRQALITAAVTGQLDIDDEAA